MNQVCVQCNKPVYQVDLLEYLDKCWHNQCLRCTECKTTLNMKTCKGFNKLPYCVSHCPAATLTDPSIVRGDMKQTLTVELNKYHENRNAAQKPLVSAKMLHHDPKNDEYDVSKLSTSDKKKMFELQITQLNDSNKQKLSGPPPIPRKPNVGLDFLKDKKTNDKVRQFECESNSASNPALSNVLDLSMGSRNLTRSLTMDPKRGKESVDLVRPTSAFVNILSPASNSEKNDVSDLSTSDKKKLFELQISQSVGDKTIKHAKWPVSSILKKVVAVPPDDPTIVEKVKHSQSPLLNSRNVKSDQSNDCVIITQNVEDYQLDYNKKIMAYNSKVLPLFGTLENIVDVNMESCIGQYLKANNLGSDLMSWFRGTYAPNMSLCLINDVILKFGHNMTVESIKIKYSEFAREKNDKFRRCVPQSLQNHLLENKFKLITIDEVNRNYIIPKYMDDEKINEKKLWQIITKKEKYTERESRMLLVELDLQEEEKVKFLQSIMRDPKMVGIENSLLDGDVIIKDIRDLCMKHVVINDVVTILRNECSVCSCQYPIHLMQSFFACTDHICNKCFKEWLTYVIMNKYPSQWGCPVCTTNDETVNTQIHFLNLQEFMSNNAFDENLQTLFNDKLLDSKLMDSKSFHRCSNENCVYGFEAVGDNMKIQCPECHTYTCVKCDREWKDEHDNLSCDEYYLWMQRNNSSSAKVAQCKTIRCPNCNMLYELADGGCLHFDCKVCKWSFCGSCFNQFVKECTVDRCVIKNSFHAHHPRNCYNYLRDYSSMELEDMLKGFNYPKLIKKSESKCTLLTTVKETGKENPCNQPVYNTTDRCESHYKEYLVEWIHKLKIDPADFVNNDSLILMLKQGHQDELKKYPAESDDVFRERLIIELKRKCPIYIGNVA